MRICLLQPNRSENEEQIICLQKAFRKIHLNTAEIYTIQELKEIQAKQMRKEKRELTILVFNGDDLDSCEQSRELTAFIQIVLSPSKETLASGYEREIELICIKDQGWSMRSVANKEICQHVSDEELAINIIEYIEYLQSLTTPLDKKFLLSDLDFEHQILKRDQSQIPLGGTHPGSFGFIRKNHVHEGLDLYANKLDPVYCMEEGTVLKIFPFTGAHLSTIGKEPTPWWNDTYAILIKGKSGILNYGELTPKKELAEGQIVRKGDCIGYIKTVLKKDKGRPMNMLHLERYTLDAESPTDGWGLGMKKPKNLICAKSLLLAAEPRL